MKISDRQETLFDLKDYQGSDSGQWGWIEPDNTELVPNSPTSELGTKKKLVPNSEIWKPPIGCLNHKWIKDQKYWYWSYYKSKGKKTSLYLAKDYNKAIAKAKKIGMPPNAKPAKLRATPPET
jgi:hypothetical protein